MLLDVLIAFNSNFPHRLAAVHNSVRTHGDRKGWEASTMIKLLFKFASLRFVRRSVGVI